MMIIAHDSDRYGYLAMNGAPIPPEHIARRCGIPLEQYTTLLDELTDAGVPSRTPEGIIFSRRMVRDAKDRENNRKRQLKYYYSTHPPNGNLTHNLTANYDNDNDNSLGKGIKEEGGAGGRNLQGGTLPTLAMVKERAKFIGVPEADAEVFWNHFEASGWIDKNGNRIVRWESKLAAWKANSQQHQAKKGPSILDLKTILEAKEYQADELKKRYCSELAMGETWSNQEKLEQWKTLKREIRATRQKLSGMA